MNPDSVFLTDLAWIGVATALIAWAAVRVWPGIIDTLEHLAVAFLRHRERTRLDRMARAQRAGQVRR